MRQIIPVAALLSWATPLHAQAPWPTDAWPRSTPAEQGMRPAPIDSLHAAVTAGTYGLIDRFIVVRNGYLVADHTYPRDYREISRGVRTPVGCGPEACRGPAEVHQFNYLHPDFHPFPTGRKVHTLQSVTKSVTATLIGIAITRGEVPPVTTPLPQVLREYDFAALDPRLRRATLEDLLTMRLGIEWHESDRPADSTNTTFAMELSDNWVAYTLSQPMDTEPGDSFNYNSGASHLMSAILRTATGLNATQYAERHLFGPLGIRDYHWKIAPEGLPDTEGGLYLEAPDLAKIGLLYLRGGEWNDARVVSREWVDGATARQVTRNVGPPGAGWGYGYQWWRLDRRNTVVWAGLGFGGQYLLVLPEHDAIGVINSWNLFGRPSGNMLGDAIDALIASVGGG